MVPLAPLAAEGDKGGGGGLETRHPRQDNHKTIKRQHKTTDKADNTRQSQDNTRQHTTRQYKTITQDKIREDKNRHARQDKTRQDMKTTPRRKNRKNRTDVSES